MVVGDMLRFLLDIQMNSTHDSKYIVETLLEMYDIEELPHGKLY